MPQGYCKKVVLLLWKKYTAQEYRKNAYQPFTLQEGANGGKKHTPFLALHVLTWIQLTAYIMYYLWYLAIHNDIVHYSSFKEHYRRTWYSCYTVIIFQILLKTNGAIELVQNVRFVILSISCKFSVANLVHCGWEACYGTRRQSDNLLVEFHLKCFCFGWQGQHTGHTCHSLTASNIEQ